MHALLDRRRWMQVSSLGFLSTGLPRTICSAGPAFDPARTIDSCILIFYYGGPSHLDTYDMKPDAPAEVKGEYKPIQTSLPGLRICEHQPHMAKLMHRVTLIRSMHHGMRNHNSAAAETLTGRPPAGGDLELLNDDGNNYPCFGSVLSYAHRNQQVPVGFAALPHTMYNIVQLPGQSAGFLGAQYERFQIAGNPNDPNFNVQAIQMPPDMDSGRLGSRESLLRQFTSPPGERAGARLQASYDKAFAVLGSERLRAALDMGKEAPKTRERYGHNLHGQSVLLARRLTEAGVQFVTVFDGAHNGQDANWDSHATIFPRHKALIPPADLALSALIEDLEQRGRLDSTLVIAFGEFGRTPKINGSAGRDHWPDCYSVILAGGGTKPGLVYGASDRIGAYPKDDPVTPADLAATLFWKFGVDPKQEVRDLTDRPFHLADGRVLGEVFG